MGQARFTEDPERRGPQTRERPPPERGEGAGPRPKRRTSLFTAQTATAERKRGRCPRQSGPRAPYPGVYEGAGARSDLSSETAGRKEEGRGSEEVPPWGIQEQQRWEGAMTGAGRVRASKTRPSGG